MIWYLQVSVALVFFFNKVLILNDMRVGWLMGAFASVCSILYFYLIGLYMFMVLGLGVAVLMAYGYFKSSLNDPRIENTIRAITVITMLVLTWFAYSGLMTIVELTASAGLLAGAYYLPRNQIRLGWSAYLMAHGLSAVVTYDKGQLFFADLQVASAIVSIVGIMKTFEKKS